MNVSVAPSPHWLDRLYASVVRGPLFFPDGSGPEELVHELEARADPFCADASIEIDWLGPARRQGSAWVRRGRFTTPFPRPLLPQASHTAYIEVLKPAGADD